MGFKIRPILDRAATLFGQYQRIETGIRNDIEISQRYQNFERSQLRGFAGLKPSEAKAISSAVTNTPYSRKNLWFLEIENSGEAVNLFAIDIDYNMATVRSDKRIIGGITIDTVQGRDPVELRITCYDDIDGSIKKWFLEAIEKTSSADGTVGLPGDYAMKIRVVHGNIVDHDKSYRFDKLFRPVSIETNLSRRDQALEELQLSFTEIETQF